MPSSDLEIVNVALGLLGAAEIGDFETTETGVTARGLYDETLEYLLSKHPWRWARRKTMLSPLAETPVAHWTYAFQLPSNRRGDVFTVYSDASEGALPLVEGTWWVRSEETLLANLSPLYLEYSLAKSPGEWPAVFTRLFTRALAADLAEPVTGSSERGDRFRAEAFGPRQDVWHAKQGRGGLFAEAVRQDRASTGGKRLADRTLIDARRRRV